MAVIRSTSRSVLAGLVVVAGAALAGCGAGQISQTALQSPTVDGTSAQVGAISIRNAAVVYPDQGSYPKGSTARLRMVIANAGTTSDTLTEVRSDAADEVTISAAGSSTAGQTPTPTASSSGTSGSPTPTDTAGGTPTGSVEPPNSSVTGTATAGPSASGSASPSTSDSASATATASASAAPTDAAPARVAIPPNGFVSFSDAGPTVSLVGLKQQLYPSQPISITLVFQKAGSVTMTVAVSAPEGQISLAPTVTSDTQG